MSPGGETRTPRRVVEAPLTNYSWLCHRWGKKGFSLRQLVDATFVTHLDVYCQTGATTTMCRKGIKTIIQKQTLNSRSLTGGGDIASGHFLGPDISGGFWSVMACSIQKNLLTWKKMKEILHAKTYHLHIWFFSIAGQKERGHIRFESLLITWQKYLMERSSSYFTKRWFGTTQITVIFQDNCFLFYLKLTNERVQASGHITSLSNSYLILRNSTEPFVSVDTQVLVRCMVAEWR